jgi:hypothetical protein
MREFKFFDYNTPNNPSYYDIRGYDFIGVSSEHYDEILHKSYKFMLFRHIETGFDITANIIYEDHPMFNYNN